MMTATILQFRAAPTPAPVVPSEGPRAAFNITTASVIKDAPGRIHRLSVIADIVGMLSVHDAADLAGLGNENMICNIPSPPAGTLVPIDCPCMVGVVVVPGNAGIIAVLYS
jgi:hypothetical protein